VQALRGQRLTAWSALHAATRGAAEAMRLGHEIGSLEPGLAADVCVWARHRGEVPAHRLSLARELHEEIFAWLTLGDERLLHSAWVGGRCLFRS